MLQLPNYFDKR